MFPSIVGFFQCCDTILTIALPPTPTGRPRPHGPARRRPRIPQLDVPGGHARRAQGRRRRLLGPATACDGVVARLAEALPVVHVVLRAILRRGHVGGAVALLGGPLPARQLSRRPRRQPRSLRPVLDRHDGGADPVPGRQHQPVARDAGHGALCVRLSSSQW